MEKWGEDHIINVFNDKPYTYHYYKKNIENLSKDFSEINIKNEPVIIIMDDSPTCISCFLSLINIGAKPLILSPKTITKSIKQIIDISKSRIIITDPSTKIEKKFSGVNVFVVSENSILNKTNIKGVPFEIKSNVSYLGLTSGSSGTPKIVMHSLEEMKSATHYYAKNTLEIEKDDILFSVPKINFTYGLANSLFFSFATGARSIIYEGTLSSEQIIQLVNKYTPTYFFAVPIVFEHLSKENNIEKSYFPKVNYFISAGDYLSQKVTTDWFNKTGKYVFDSVGCSETGSAYLVNMNPENKSGSAGVAVDGYDLTLIAGDDKQGMLVVDGPSNAIGYLNDAERTTEKFINGKVHTGDWFKIDDEGYYWFLGRCDDMVKKNGRWISLNEITNYVKKKPEVKNAATFLSNGKIVLVIDVSSVDYQPESLLKKMREDFEHYKVPDIINIGTVPFNENGKIDYTKLRDTYETH